VTESSLALAVIVIAITIALESLANFDSLFSVFVVAVAVAAGLLFYLSTESLVWCIGFGLGTAETPTPSPPLSAITLEPLPTLCPSKQKQQCCGRCMQLLRHEHAIYVPLYVRICMYIPTNYEIQQQQQ